LTLLTEAEPDFDRLDVDVVEVVEGDVVDVGLVVLSDLLLLFLLSFPASPSYSH
jgi:hypothetical protein